jgi:hypothetical protein
MRLQHLERYKAGGSGKKLQLAIPLPRTADGRIYRFSPNPNAHPRHFLLGERVQGFTLPKSPTPRMTRMPGTPGTICPYSGVTDQDDAFTQPEDITAAREIVAHAVQTDLAELAHGMLDSLSRSAGSRFTQIQVGPIAVQRRIATRPPHRTVGAACPHTAPTSGG